MQDAVINVASLLGMNIEHEVNERIPAYKLLGAMINGVIYDEFVSKYLHFLMINYGHCKGGNEIFLRLMTFCRLVENTSLYAM